MCCTFSSSRKSMTRSVYWTIVILEHKICLEVSPSELKHLVSRTRMYWYWSMFSSNTWSSDSFYYGRHPISWLRHWLTPVQVPTCPHK
jgi:hypothetical protein